MAASLTRRSFPGGAAAVVLNSATGCTLNQREGSSSPDAKPSRIYLDYDQAGLDAAYDQRVWAPNMDRVLTRLRLNAKAALSRLGEPQRLAYGPTDAERLDLYRTDHTNGPIQIYIHGGAWRSSGGFGSAASIAEVFVRSGAHFIAPDYVLVQDARGSLFPMVDQVRRAVAWTYENAATFGGAPNRIYISGHSAGGHLAGVVLTTDWDRDFGIPDDVVKGGLCSSGMFDLYPVSLSARREYVAFDVAMVEALSPLRHLEKIKAPVIVSYGTAESPEFQRQSQQFAAALTSAGKPVELIVGEGYNHFEILETLSNPFGLLGRAALSQIDLGAVWFGGMKLPVTSLATGSLLELPTN